MAPALLAAPATISNMPVSLQLAKISHCTSLQSGSRMQWKHLPNRDGMFAVFDIIRRRSIDESVIEKRILKIVDNGEQLDEIDLDAVKQQASFDEELLRSKNISDDSLRVIVIVKKPLLALRYQLSYGYTRRIQLNFNPESGFDYAVNALQSVGLPIRFKGDPDTTSNSVSRSSRPHSVQATTSSTVPRSSQERSRNARGSQSHASSTTRLTRTPPPTPRRPPVYPSHNLPMFYHQVLPVSGVNQDEFSRPLLSHQNYSRLETNLGLSSQRVQQSLNTPTEHHLDSEYVHVSQPSSQTQNSSFGWIPYKPEQTRPTTAPATMSEDLVPDSLPLSQLLPPDRILPFPETTRRPDSRTSGKFKASKQLLEPGSGVAVKAKSSGRRNERAKAKKSREIRRNSATRCSSRTPSITATHYNLRPGSSSSNVGTIRPSTQNTTSSGDVAHNRDRRAGSKARLAREGWALSEAEFLQYFNDEAFSNNAFLEDLVKFAKIEKDFTAAYPSLIAAQKERQSQLPHGHKFREWISNDVKNAISIYKGSRRDIRTDVAPVTKANTPKKRVRARTPTPEETQTTSQDQGPDAMMEDNHILLPAPTFSPKPSIITRKRPASALDENQGDLETESRNTDAMGPPALPEKQSDAAALPSDTQNQPKSTQTCSTVILEQQATTNPSPSHPTEPPSLLPATAAAAAPTALSLETVTIAPTTSTTTAPSTNPIPTADLLSILDTWAKTSPLFQAPHSATNTTPSTTSPTTNILPQTTRDLLADYAAQDDETRIQTLDDMICECLEDENFAKLAQDVEGAWMRIGLGF